MKLTCAKKKKNEMKEWLRDSNKLLKLFIECSKELQQLTTYDFLVRTK